MSFRRRTGQSKAESYSRNFGQELDKAKLSYSCNFGEVLDKAKYTYSCYFGEELDKTKLPAIRVGALINNSQNKTNK